MNIIIYLSIEARFYTALVKTQIGPDQKCTRSSYLVSPTCVCGDTVLQLYTVLDSDSDCLPSFCLCAPEHMMVTTVISDSDSDSEFKQDIQEATRCSLITVAPSPVREVASDSDDDEEKVAIKRLLSFPNHHVEVGESWKVSVQSIQLDPSHNTNCVRNTCLVPTYLSCRFLRTRHCHLGRQW